MVQPLSAVDAFNEGGNAIIIYGISAMGLSLGFIGVYFRRARVIESTTTRNCWLFCTTSKA